MEQTLYDKLWNDHVIRTEPDGTALLYVDRHLVHEVTSPQAYEGLRLANRKPWRSFSIVATADHNTPTDQWERGLREPISRAQVETLDANIREFGALAYFPFRTSGQGIVHVIGPELGATLPGMTVVCGDSHTSTHGAFACLAHGIGTSEVEHVLATQCLLTRKSRAMRVEFSGTPSQWVTAKDMALALIGKIGTAGGTGYAIEFCGQGVHALSMEGRMTLCNMAIEAGARVGFVAVDDTTLEYLLGRPFAPKGALWERASKYWRTLISDEGAQFDASISMDITQLVPQITWGTSPEMVTSIDGAVPAPDDYENSIERANVKRALEYMNLQPRTAMTDIAVDQVFIGSCTNGRIEDLRAAASEVQGRTKAENVRRVLVVPGSGAVRRQAEAEGLHRIFRAAGFEWREPGCSMCLGMNEDRLQPGERCAATSNRNFEGRQGAGGRTHLVSPRMAAAAAVAGHFVDISKQY